jgi:UDP-N-acetylglucosamine 2-epimerase
MKNYKENIAIILGTRAELIKTFTVMLELEKNKKDYYFIHTGQHNLEDLCKKFSIKSPDAILTKEPEKSSKFNSGVLKAIFWNVSLIFKIKKELKKLKNLKYVLYHGDTMTTTSAALASSKMLNPFKKYRNIHLEAGLRSGNIFEPFPEEISRRIADKFSDILLVASERSGKNVEKYKDKKIIHFGNTVLDSSNTAHQIALNRKIKPLAKEKFAIISIHRHENIKSEKRLSKIVEILNSLNIKSFFTMHDNTRNKLIEYGLLEKINKNKNITIIPPLDYISFIYQLKKCSLIICDGGSMQEESLIFKKPCIILRMNTERQEGLETNFQFLSKLDVEKTKEKIKEYLSPNFRIKEFKNPYGKVGLSKKILKELK